MSASNRDALWRRLGDAGLVTGHVPPASVPTAPWYVRTMLGVAGWIGAMFLLGFVGAGLAFIFKTEEAGLAVGGACCAAAYLIFAKASRHDLASQFALAVSLAGQVMFIVGLSGLVGNSSQSPTFFFAVAIFEAALAATVANFVHRVWSTLASVIAFGYALHLLGLPGVATGAVATVLAVLWLHESEWIARSALWRPVGFGLALSLLQFDIVPLLGDGILWRHEVELLAPWTLWIGPVLVAAVLLYVVSRLIARHGVATDSRTGIAALTATIVVAAATLNAPGVASSLLIMVLGFAGGNRTLHGLGAIGMLGYMSHFYYSLDATLLMKSAALGGTGLVLLALWAATRMVFGPAPVREAANA